MEQDARRNSGATSLRSVAGALSCDGTNRVAGSTERDDGGKRRTMPLLRELGDIERFPYLAGLGLDPDDAGRMQVSGGAATQGGFYVDAATGEARLFDRGDPIPPGVWLAQEEIDGLKPGLGADAGVGPGGGHGFGEGWGTQGRQIGGDASRPEEDTGGTRRATPEEAPGSGDDPIGIERAP